MEIEPIELDVATAGDGYSLAWGSDTIVTSFGDTPVVHESSDLIRHMISEFGRYPTVTIERSVIVEPRFFGAYSIYGIQKAWIESRRDEVSTQFASELARDPVMTRLPGPEATDQFARYGPLVDWLSSVDLYLVDVDFVEGIDDLVPDVTGVTGPYPSHPAATEGFRKLVDYLEGSFRSLSPEERAAVVFLHNIHRGSLLHGLALVNSHCTPEQYATGVQAGHLALGRIASDVSDDDHEQSFDNLRDDARTALSYVAAYRSGTPQGRLRDLLSAGEGRDVEFKSTLRYDLKNETKNKELTKAVVKTVAAFLNTDGGTLVIGVADDGRIIGIEKDGFDNPDKFLLHLYQSLRNAIGDVESAEVSHEIVEYSDRHVCIIDCDPSDDGPVLARFKGDPSTHLFVRTGPSTIDLDFEQRADYVRRRWNTEPISP